MSLQGLIPPLLDFRYIISAIGWALLRAGHPRRGVVRWLLELEWSETSEAICDSFSSMDVALRALWRRWNSQHGFSVLMKSGLVMTAPEGTGERYRWPSGCSVPNVTVSINQRYPSSLSVDRECSASDHAPRGLAGGGPSRRPSPPFVPIRDRGVLSRQVVAEKLLACGYAGLTRSTRL